MSKAQSSSTAPDQERRTGNTTTIADTIERIIAEVESRIREKAENVTVNIYHVTVSGNYGSVTGLTITDQQDSRNYHGQPVFTVEKNSTANFTRGASAK